MVAKYKWQRENKIHTQLLTETNYRTMGKRQLDCMMLSWSLGWKMCYGSRILNSQRFVAITEKCPDRFDCYCKRWHDCRYEIEKALIKAVQLWSGRPGHTVLHKWHACGTVAGPLHWNATSWTGLVRSHVASYWHKSRHFAVVIYNTILYYNVPTMKFQRILIPG